MKTVYDWFGYEIPIEKRYKLIKEAGFDGVLLWWSNGFGRDDSGQNGYLKGPQLAREAGLFIENIHTPLDNQDKLWLDNLEGEAVTETYLKCVSDCAEYEIPTMVVHLPHEEHTYNELGLNRIKRVAEKAEKLGINVAMENLRNLPNVKYILDQVDSKRVGFCYDCGHHYSHYPDVDLLSQYGSRLMALHLHDNNGEYAQHGLPFDGTVDWAMTMKNIAETGYKGSIAIEAMNWDYMNLTVEQFLHKAFKSAQMLEALKL